MKVPSPTPHLRFIGVQQNGAMRHVMRKWTVAGVMAFALSTTAACGGEDEPNVPGQEQGEDDGGDDGGEDDGGDGGDGGDEQGD